MLIGKLSKNSNSLRHITNDEIMIFIHVLIFMFIIMMFLDFYVRIKPEYIHTYTICIYVCTRLQERSQADILEERFLSIIYL